MGVKVNASMPPELDLGPNWTVKINAVDPNDGSDVTGVTVSNFSISCTSVGSGALDFGTFKPVLLRTNVSGG
jgi:hypothetical protein